MADKPERNPMHPLPAPAAAPSRRGPEARLPDWRTTLPLARSCPRCGAKTRSAGACRSPAMANGRCRMHGDASTGPRTAEGLERLREAGTKHGLNGAECPLGKSYAAVDEASSRVMEANSMAAAETWVRLS